jgi:hypothetical protein
MKWVVFLVLPTFAFADTGQVQNLLRLFSTPQQRASLDRLRYAPNIDASSPPALAANHRIHIQGYVIRNDGKSGTVWLNNQALLESSQHKEVIVGKLNPVGNKVFIKLPNQALSLKVGQEYDAAQNKIVERSGSVRNTSPD